MITQMESFSEESTLVHKIQEVYLFKTLVKPMGVQKKW